MTADAERIRRTLHLELITATCEPDRAVLRCAMNLLKGAEPFEIDPITGVGRTIAAFQMAAASWAAEYAWYDRKDDAETNGYRHDFAMEGRTVQVAYAAVHPELAEPAWFPGHGVHNCMFCLTEANKAAGLPAETGMDPVTGGIAKPKQDATVAAMPPGLEAGR